MAEKKNRISRRRQDLELDFFQHWFCRGKGHFSIENFRPLKRALGLLFQVPVIRKCAEDYGRIIKQTTFCWSFDTLPQSFHNYRILHLSDVHIDAFEGLVESILNLVEDTRPDAIVFTGDYRFDTGGNNHLMLKYMAQLVAGLPSCDGVYGILGNHDSGSFVEPLEAMGMQMLINERVELRRGGERIALIGLDDCHYYGTDDLSGALDGIDPELFKLLLVHSPELFEEAEQSGIDFYLCGHTHGGQIRMPGLGALLLNAACPRRYCDRSWSHGHTQGYTHRGTGSSCVPLRINCPPEITLHILSSGAKA